MKLISTLLRFTRAMRLTTASASSTLQPVGRQAGVGRHRQLGAVRSKLGPC